MAISFKAITKITDGLRNLLKTIGVEGDTKMPKSKDNRTRTAFFFYLWYNVRKHADSQYGFYKKQLVTEGIIFDHEKEPRGPQPETDLVTVDYVKITLEVARPYPNVLETRLIKFLETRISKELLDEAITYASQMTKPAHTFRAYLVHG